MRRLLVIVALVVALGPLPPLLPAKPGPATYRQYRAHCAATYYPTTWPARCPRAAWGVR